MTSTRALPVLLSAVLLGLGATAQEGWRQPESWTEPLEPFRIADGLYHVGTVELTSFLLAGDAGHVLIDAPLEENVGLVLDNIESLGFDPAEVKVQLISHGHFDHAGGVAALLEATGADLVLSRAGAELVAAGGKGDFFLGDEASYTGAPADRIVADGETVRVGDVALTAHLTPGHTRGCTSWSGEVTMDGEPLTFVSVCSLSVLPGYRLVGEDASYPGIAADFCGSVARLRRLDPDIFLASHASFVGLTEKAEALAAGQARAFVDPERYRRFLDRAQERIEATLGEQGEPGGCAAVLAATGSSGSG